MAEIKIIGSIKNTQQVSRFNFEDTNLLISENLNENFGIEGDYIELFLYDNNNNILDINYNYKNFKTPSNTPLNLDSTLSVIEIDPTKDIQNIGYNNGVFNSQYNFFRRKISSNQDDIYISEISSDRTEIRINSVNIPTKILLFQTQQLIDELNSSLYQKYYLINFSPDVQQVVINVAIDNNSILLKLYEPLSKNILVKDTLWLVEEIIYPYTFNIDLSSIIIPDPAPQLKGPNFDINVDIKQNLSTEYQNYNNLVSSLTGSSYYKVLNYMNDLSYDLNIDYTSFNNFINFSSAEKRLEIFYNKIKLIEDYNTNIVSLNNSVSVLKNNETSSIKLKIDNITKNFDGFENYLYFESSSFAWPKLNNNKPYSLLSTGSITTKNWFTSFQESSSNYDSENQDRLYNIIPDYIKNDPGNYQSYYTFIDMIGHYFDNIWIYITSINKLYNADNNLEKGVSKDIVYDALKSLGVKLYNSKGDNKFNDYIGGLNSGSSIFVDTLSTFNYTSSYLNNIPKKDLLAETYKRIYHNLILLNKGKGTSTGLQNLITAFGITSSIFQPKEFGGSNKKNQLKGYDNDKITIQNNTITGSVLSPFISLQQPFTASSDFTSTDLHFIDLSFSPQTELNSRISSSVALSNPTFSLDQYIGDPRLIESSSYDDLIIQQNYFTSASAAISGSAQRLDYKEFFELVKYFDNSLFKMLKDFVPARTNALTGITIKSPVLERNKIPIYHPKITKETTYDVNYKGPVISEDKNYYHNIIPGNKSSFYNGELTGSYVNINDVFEKSNPNPYLHPSNSIDVNQFEHTDFNVTLNNISSSILSISRQKLETKHVAIGSRIYTNYNDITSSAELQESNLSLQGHQNSRYEGTKLSSKTYNVYSSSSLTYSGDISYGKTAVIDHNTRKIGLFYQISENKYFNYPFRNNVFIKYLVDEKGNLTELNKKNKNWNEVQNIFKLGDFLTVSQFDSSRNSSTTNQTQKSTDGSKFIYNSGYSYFPIIYASNLDSKLYFNYTGDTKSKLFKIKNSGGFISGSNNDKYSINQGKIYKIFQNGTDTFDAEFNDGNTYYKHNNSLDTFSTYSIQETSNQRIKANFIVEVEFPTVNLLGSFTFNINKVGTLTPLATATLSSISGFTSRRNSVYKYIKKTDYDATYTLPQAVKVYDGNGSFLETLGAGTLLRQVTASPELRSYDYNNPCDFVTSTQFYITSTAYDESESISGCDRVFILSGNNLKLYETPVSKLIDTLNFNVSTDYTSFTVGDQISYEFIVGSGGFNTNNFTASIKPYVSNPETGFFSNELAEYQVGNNPFATSSLNNLPAPFISGSLNNTLIFNKSLSYFANYLFLPSGSTPIVKNSLYNTYSEVEYNFSPKSGDIITIYYNGGYFESIILSVFIDLSKKLNITLSSELPSNLNKLVYAEGDIIKFLILSKVNDETNLILTFDKKPGDTSLGFIIPNNLHPDVLKNIDIITKEVKQKLLDLGSSSGNSAF